MTEKTMAGDLEVLTDAPTLGHPILLEMRIRNDSGAAVGVSTFEPTAAPPELEWKHSIEAYKIGVLVSLGILAIDLYDEHGCAVESKGLAPWVTPVLATKPVGPGDSLRLGFDVDELFDIRSPGRYRAQVTFHDKNVAAEAGTVFDISQSVR